MRQLAHPCRGRPLRIEWLSDRDCFFAAAILKLANSLPFPSLQPSFCSCKAVTLSFQCVVLTLNYWQLGTLRLGGDTLFLESGTSANSRRKSQRSARVRSMERQGGSITDFFSTEQLAKRALGSRIKRACIRPRLEKVRPLIIIGSLFWLSCSKRKNAIPKSVRRNRNRVASVELNSFSKRLRLSRLFLLFSQTFRRPGYKLDFVSVSCAAPALQMASGSLRDSVLSPPAW